MDEPVLCGDTVGTETFLVEGSCKCKVRLTRSHVVLENYPRWFSWLECKTPLMIPIQHLLAVKTRTSICNSIQSNSFRRYFLFKARQIVDNSNTFESIPDEEENSSSSWSHISRGDTLVLHYVSINSKDCKWTLKEMVLRQSEEVIAKWVHLLECALYTVSKDRPKKLLIFVNPFGGKGQARSIFENQVVPLFRLAGVKYEVVVTQYANHARDMLRISPLEGFDGVACVGGDGMFSELFNGLLTRSMESSGIDLNDSVKPELLNNLKEPLIRVGHIPGGSTNAVALSLHGTVDVVTATLHIVLGDRRNIDVASVWNQDNVFHRFFMAMISYGYFGDLMVYSEKLRWLGPKRYDVSGVHTFLENKSYKGVVQFTEDEEDASLEDTGKTDPKAIESSCTVNCSKCHWAKLYRSASLFNKKVVSRVMEGEFTVVTAAVMICACKHTPKGVSPSAHLGDGHMDLILVRKTSRFNYFRYLYRTGYLNRNPFTLPFVEIYRVREFAFIPQYSDENVSSGISVWNCDGEVLHHPQIRVKVHCQILPVFGRGLERT